MERPDSFKEILRNVKRKLSTTERKQSRQETERPVNTSLKSSSFSSDNVSPARSPFSTPRKIEESPNEETESLVEEEPELETPPPVHIPLPVPPVPARSPLPPDSPLLRSRTASPALQRARNFNKELRRQASFKASRERQSGSRTSSPVCSRNPSPARETEISFKIKKSLGSRKGWMIMQEDAEEGQGQEALKTVIQMIREMECQGFIIPEKITVKAP